MVQQFGYLGGLGNCYRLGLRDDTFAESFTRSLPKFGVPRASIMTNRNHGFRCIPF